MEAETREERRRAMDAARGEFQALAIEALAPLRQKVREGDVGAIKLALQYGMLTAKEEEDRAQSDALQLLAKLAGTDVETLVLHGLDDRMMRSAGVHAFAVQLAQALAGDLQAARYVCDRTMGEPVQTLALRSQSMSEEEAREALVLEYMADGLAEDEARRMASMPSAKQEAGDEAEGGH